MNGMKKHSNLLRRDTNAKKSVVFSSSRFNASLNAFCARSLLSFNQAPKATNAGANQYLGVNNINSSVAFCIVS